MARRLYTGGGHTDDFGVTNGGFDGVFGRRLVADLRLRTRWCTGWSLRNPEGPGSPARFARLHESDGSWSQSQLGCDKTLSLHYEPAWIRDFGFRTPRSWIHWSQVDPMVHPSR